MITLGAREVDVQRELHRLRVELEELRASRRRLVLAADADRRTIERDLHDGVHQHLISLAVSLQLAGQAEDSDPAALPCAPRRDGPCRARRARGDGAARAADPPGDPRGGRPGRTASLGLDRCGRSCQGRRVRGRQLPAGGRDDDPPGVARHARSRRLRRIDVDRRARHGRHPHVRDHRTRDRVRPRSSTPCEGVSRPSAAGSRSRRLAGERPSWRAHSRSNDDASRSLRGRERRP